MPATEQIQNSITAIENLIGMELLDQAEKLCLTTIQSQGENAQLLNYLGVIEHRRGNLSKALSRFEKAEDYAPNNPELLRNAEITRNELGIAPQTADDIAVSKPMGFTGERYVPELTGQIAYEHYHRYAFAREYAKGNTVLDIASGEGYGTALLAQVAGSVLGVDISSEAVKHSSTRYSRLSNLEFRQGRCEDIPAADGSFDLLVSFETIEHIENQEAFLSEVTRVLNKDGLFIVSSPNKKVYTDEKNYKNPYHLKELYKDQLNNLLHRYFANVHLFGQRLTFSSHIWPLEKTSSTTFAHYTRSNAEVNRGVDPPFEDEYTLAVCSNHNVRMQSGASLLTSDKDEMYQDFTNRGAVIERLDNELAQARARWIANAIQVQSAPKPSPHMLEVYAISSIEDYRTFVSENRPTAELPSAQGVDCQKSVERIVSMEDFPLRATLPESDIRQAFASLGSWYTGFKFNGHLYGGHNAYTNDPRLEDFLTWYKEGGDILELGSFEASHTLRLVQSPQVRSVLGLEGRDYLLTRSKLIKLLSGSDKMNFAQCNFERDDISSFGRFNVVFCSGLLYLLSKPWELIEKVAAVSDNLFLSTHIANSVNASVLGHDGEFHPGGAYQDPLGALTTQSFWLTFESLVKTLAENGFKIVNVRHFNDWGGYQLVDLFCSKVTATSALSRREQPAPEVREEEHIAGVEKEARRHIEYSTQGAARDEDYLRLVEEIVMKENFSIDTSLSESQISDSFKELGPWRTKFTFNGKHYGGESSYAGDPRVRDFFTWFRKGGAVLEIGSFEGSHTLRLVQNPRIESVLGLEGRDYLVRRSKLIKSISGSDKMNFVQCDFETEDISSYGEFDAVFCSGLLYHLSKPWELIEKITAITDNLFLSTHYAKTGSISLHDLEGEYYHEGPFEDPLSGLTPQSFWPTYDSLTRVLENNGFRVINARHFDNWGGHKLANIFCSKENHSTSVS
ncbi:MAG: methyltransferase domain-containing protein [Bacteroidetes bacterium]|nr:methyltransferase domain-containing protein [Bacteroidota bacterium]